MVGEKDQVEPKPVIIDESPEGGGPPLWSNGQRGWADPKVEVQKETALKESLLEGKVVEVDVDIPLMADKGDQVILLEQHMSDGKITDLVKFINLTRLADSLGKDVSLLSNEEIRSGTDSKEFVYLDHGAYFVPTKASQRPVDPEVVN